MPPIIGRGSERDRAALQLYTAANRNYVENERPDEERAIEGLQAALRFVKSVSPTAKCRSLTAMYNCIGLVFACRRTMVDCKHLNMILRDDGYSPIPQGRAMEGDVVIYSNKGIPQHIGIVYEMRDVSLVHDGSRIEIWVLSQWGEDGEYLHKMREVPPIYGDQIEFWSERKPAQ